VAGVRFVHNAQELRDYLASAVIDVPDPCGRAGEFFTIDPALPRWRQFFALTPG
jgi:hypothetical protein